MYTGFVFTYHQLAMITTALDLVRAYVTGDICPIKALDTLYEHIDDTPNAFISLTKKLA